MKNGVKFFVGVGFLFASAGAAAGIFTSDGNSFEECLENRRADITNSSQYAIAAQFCRKKHPLPSLDTSQFVPAKSAPPPEPVDLMLVNGTDGPSPARPRIELLNVSRVAVAHDGQSYYAGIKSPDFRWYTALTVNNRNTFPVSAVIVGITKSGSRQCSWNEADYAEVYDCRGSAGAKMTGQFKCYIPDVERRKLNYCVIGMGIIGTFSDLNRYLK